MRLPAPPSVGTGAGRQGLQYADFKLLLLAIRHKLSAYQD